jgi:hypothetical protein
MRESNLLQAGDIPRKLRAIGCYRAPLSSGRRTTQFDHDEVERLAIMEHDRCNAELLQRQWRQRPRDPAKRTNPFLTPWADLDEPVKQYDRAAARAIPGALATIGWGIYPVGPTC